MKLSIAGLVFAVAVVPLQGQQTGSAPATDASATAARTTLAGEAPEDVTKRLSELVHAGKYTEAQRLTTGLLLAYPNDQRFVKVQALLEKLIAPDGQENEAPNNIPTTSIIAPSAPGTSGAQFRGMDNVDYNALVELIRQADQSPDLEQQKKSLKQFMDLSSAFLQKHPAEIKLWQLRATSAMNLDDPMAGYEAGQKLLGMGAADSNDVNVQRLLAQLKNKGWLDKQILEDHLKLAEQTEKFAWLLGTWSLSIDHHLGGLAGLVRSDRMDGPDEEFSWRQKGPVASVIEGYNVVDGVKSSGPDLVGTVLDTGEIRWERYLSPSGGGSLALTYGGHLSGYDGSGSKAYYPSGWQPVISSEIVDDKKTMRMVIPSQNSSPKSKEPWKQVVILSFTRSGITR